MRNGPSETKLPSFLHLDNTLVVGQNNKRRRNQMPTNDDFSSDHTLPSFLLEQTGKSGIWKPSDLAVFPSRILKLAILITSAIVLGIATFMTGNPIALVTELTASFGDKSVLQPVTDQSTSTVRASADAQATPPPTTKDQRSGGENNATEVAEEEQAKTVDAATEALFRQFQAWAAENDTKALQSVQPVQDAPVQPVQEAASPPAQDDPPAKLTEVARAPHRFLAKHRQAPATSNARAELPRQTARKLIRQPQRERVAPPRAAAARDQVVQNGAPPLLPQGFFGSRD
jgi:hypothetical protein